MSRSERFRYIVGTVIVVVWVAALLWDASHPSYNVPATVHGAMMFVVAYLFGPAITGWRDRGEP